MDGKEEFKYFICFLVVILFGMLAQYEIIPKLIR